MQGQVRHLQWKNVLSSYSIVHRIKRRLRKLWKCYRARMSLLMDLGLQRLKITTRALDLVNSVRSSMVMRKKLKEPKLKLICLRKVVLHNLILWNQTSLCSIFSQMAIQLYLDQHRITNTWRIDLIEAMLYTNQSLKYLNEHRRSYFILISFSRWTIFCLLYFS